MWRYTSLVDMGNIFKANIMGTLLLIAGIGYFRGFQDIPRAIFIIDFILTFSFTALSRLGVRLVYSHLINPKPYRIALNKRVMIIGAGTTGEFICRELLNDSRYRMEPIGFLDDNKNLHGQFIHNKKVEGSVSILSDFINEYDEAIICCPNAPRRELYKIVDICKEAGKPFRTLPSVNELMSGKLSISQLREVSLIDLLGRNEVEIDDGAINKYLKGKRVLITGAGGSIGSELVRQCLRFEPALLVMLDNSEYNLFNIERELIGKENNVLIKPLLSNIRDKDILSKVFSQYEPQVVFHAAAYKHVKMQEEFPWEAIKTNVNGTANLVKLCLEHNTEKFVLVSTDKAVKPINVMGATKRLAELICQGADSKFSTRFMAVRFGNVLGSSGSVIPIFQEQIKAGGPITITDPDMERYFINQLCTKLGLDETKSAKQGGNAEAVGMAMAQIQHECTFEPKSEILNYSADALLRVFDYRLKLAAAKEFNKPKNKVTRNDKVRIANAIARKPATIGNTVYGGRNGNARDEGYKYRGRGMIQITFKDNYTTYGKKSGHPEIVQNPDLANDPVIATDIAVAYMQSKNINWSSSSASSLANQFKSAVGYSDAIDKKTGLTQTQLRQKTGTGYFYKLINGQYPRLTSLTLEPDGTNVKAEPLPPVNTNKQEVKGAR